MDVSIVKKEVEEAHIVKIEDHSDSNVNTLVLENIPNYHQTEQVISNEALPYILKNLVNSNIQIAQTEDGEYTYIIENAVGLDGQSELELDGEHFIIEEYQENNEEETQDSEYETFYIEQVDHDEPETEEAEEVYTISEEIEEVVEENDDNEGDQEMDVVENIQNASDNIKLENKPLLPVTISNDQTQLKKLVKQEIESEEQGKELSENNIETVYDYDEDSSQEDNTVLVGEKPNYVEYIYEDLKPEKEELLIYECSICGRGFRTPTGVKRHITFNHSKSEEDDQKIKDKVDVLSFSLCFCCGEPSDSAHTRGDFQCQHCNKLFVQQNALDRHSSIEHPSGDDYKCYDCKKPFGGREQLIDHLRVHSLKNVKCEDCGKEFSRKYHLDRHIGQTGCMGLPKQVYECRVCSKSFTRKDNLAEHLKAHAGIINKNRKKFTCEFCSKEFNGLSLLKVHVRTHTGEKPYACDLCEKKFPSSGALKKHRRMHTGEKPYSCQECGQKFAAKETLNRHWRTHTGEKPHKCKYCGKAFIQAAQLRAHIFHHTGENAYTCPHCNRAFNRRLRLTTHIKYMHEGAPPLNCPHVDCKKTFFRKEDIHRHMLTHSGEKSFECDVCGKSFVVRSSLKVHQMTHRKEVPVSCEVCSRAFIRQDCLMRHMRSKHRDLLEDIVSNAEKKRLQKQLFQAVSNLPNRETVKNTIVWNELTLTESIKELLTLLVDESCLKDFGHPEAPVDKVLEAVIRKCGHTPASEADFDYIGKMRENAKLLFTVVIDDQAVKELLNNQTVDDVILHVLRLAKKQAEGTLSEDEDDHGLEDGDTVVKIETPEDDTECDIDEGVEDQD